MAFDVTPERLIMKRGQQQIVTVTKTKKTRGRTSPGDTVSGLLGGGSPNSDPKTQAKELASERPFLRTYPITVDPKLAFDLLSTMLEGSNARMQQDTGSGAITVLGRTQDHRVVAESLASFGNVESGYLVLKTEIEAQISEAQAAYDKAYRDLENTRGLVQRGYRKFKELDDAKQVVESTWLRLKNANQKLITLERSKPFTGGDAPIHDQPAVGRQTKRTYPISVDPKAAFDVLSTVLEGTGARMQQDEVSGAITVLGLKRDFDAVEELLALIKNGDGERPVNNRSVPVYDGNNFEQWADVANTDRSAKSVAGAIRACSVLAETDAQRDKLLEVLSSAARRHGKMYYDTGKSDDDEYVMNAILKAIWSQPPEFTADFVEQQLRNGNSRSMQFCVVVMNGFVDDSIVLDFDKFRRAIASRLNTLLPLYITRNQPIDGPIASANSVSREDLLKLNPNLDSLVTKLFWAETKLEDAQLVDRQSIAPLGSLAAKLQVDDVKIVEYLASQYLEHLLDGNSETKFVYDNYLEAFTNQTNDWGYVRDNEFKPLVGWHDELRSNLLLKILQTELGDEAVQHREAYQQIYKIQKCLSVLLPKMGSKVRMQAKEKLVEIKRDLPDKFKSVGGKKSNSERSYIDHNLESLIATCDGKSEPAFINPLQPNWRKKFPVMGNMLGGGDDFIEPMQPQVDAKAKTSSSSLSDNSLVYDGQNFEQWLKIAKTDRSPEAVAAAIRALGALAETKIQVSELFKVLNGAARRHGNITIDGGNDEKVMSAMLAAIWNQPPEQAVDFFEAQLKDGNSRSVQFSRWILAGGFNNGRTPDIKKLKQAFANRVGELLPLAVKRDELVSELVAAAVTVSPEQLLKRNPELQSLGCKAFLGANQIGR